MAKKCRKTIAVFLGTTLQKVKFNATELENQSGGSKPMAWNIQAVKEDVYTDIFVGKDKNAQSNAIIKVNKTMKHSKLIAKVKKYMPAATRTSRKETLNKMLLAMDLSSKKENETDKEYENRMRINGTTIRSRGIAMSKIIETVKAEFNIQKNKNLDEDTNEALTNKLLYKGSRVLSVLSLYEPIGRQISISMGYRANTDSILSDKEYYIQLGKAAVESLASTGSIKILENVDTLNNDYVDIDGRKISTLNTIEGTGIVINLDMFIDNKSQEKGFKKDEKFISNRAELNSLLEHGITNSERIQDFPSFETTFAASQIINTYTTPVNMVAPRTSDHYQKMKKKNKDKDTYKNDLYKTTGLGNVDGNEAKGVPLDVKNLFTDEVAGLAKRLARVNPIVDDIFTLLNKELVNVFDGVNGVDGEVVTLRSVFNKIGLTDPQEQAAIFGTFYGAVPDQIQSKIGQAISKENPLINLIMEYDNYKNGNPYLQAYIMYRTTRYMQDSTFLNEQAEKWFARYMVVGGEYTIERNSKAFLIVIESLVDEFMNDSDPDKQLELRSIIENEGHSGSLESKVLDALVEQYQQVFVEKQGDTDRTIVGNQLEFMSLLAGGQIKINGKIESIPFKFASPWAGLDMVAAVYDVRNSDKDKVTLSYRTKPDATASGVVLSLLQALGSSKTADKIIIDMLTKLQIAKEEGRELTEDEIYADAYDIVEKAVEQEHKNKKPTSTKQTTKDLMSEFVDIGIFKSMRDIIKPITMLTNYEASADTAIHGAAEEFADATINYLLMKAQSRSKEDRTRALDKIHEMIKEVDPSFYEINNIEKYKTGTKLPEIRLANIEGIKDILVEYFSQKDGIASRLRQLQEKQFNDATSEYKTNTKAMYNLISELNKADKIVYGTGSGNVNMSIIPAVTWHYISDPKVKDGIVTNKDHKDYKENKDGKPVGIEGTVQKNTNEYHKWYQKIITKYGMPITSKEQVLVNTGDMSNTLEPETMLVLKEEDNWLTSVVNPIHSIDAAIMLVSHDDTIKEIKQIIAANKDTQLAKDMFNELRMASGMIHDANNASATYNEIFQKHYRKNSIQMNFEYDIQEQLSMLYDSYQAIDEIMNIEDGTVIYKKDANKQFVKYTNKKVKEKQKLIQKFIIDQNMMNNEKLFGHSNTNLDGTTNSYLKAGSQESNKQESKTTEPETQVEEVAGITIDENEDIAEETKNVSQDDFDSSIFEISENVKINEIQKSAEDPNFNWSTIDKNLNRKLQSIFRKMYPKINLQYTTKDINKGGVKGQANLEAQTILINSLLQSQDTLPHEYAHHYIAMFRESPLVKQAIKKWKSEEDLVQAIGEQAVKQKGKAWNWWKKFSQYVQNLFKKIDKASKEELKNLLTDAFLTNKDIGNKQEPGSGILNQKDKTKKTKRKPGEPAKPIKKKAPRTLKQETAYELDMKNHYVDLNNPLDVMLYNLNTTVGDFAGQIGEEFIGPAAEDVTKLAHEWMYENSDIYKEQYDRSVDYWNSAPWLQSMKGYLNSWGRFKNWEDINKMISLSDKVAQDRKHIEDTKIAEINKLMEHLPKQMQNNIFETMSIAPVYWLVGEDNVLSELMELEGEEVTKAIDKWIEVYGEKIDNKDKIESLADVITYTRQPKAGYDVYNIEQLSPKTQEERIAMGSLLALYAIKRNISIDENGEIKKSYEDVFKTLNKNQELASALINISVATKKIFDDVYKMTGDKKIYRDNLLFEQFKQPKEFQIATISELKQNRYPREHGWKILRNPSADEYGVVYRDRTDETEQPGMGTSLRYKTSDILVPRDKYKPNAKNVTTLRMADKQKRHKITLTKDELTKLEMIRNPGDTLVRSYGRMIEIQDTQAIRDEILNQSMTYYINGTSEVATFDKKLKDMKTVDRPIFISLPEDAIAKKVLEENKNIGTHYEIVTNITSIGDLDKHVHLVRKDASDMVLGYKDPVLFKNNAFLRKSAYVLRQLVKMTKIHWAIVNVGKIIGDTTSNMAILAAYGVPLMDMPKLVGQALKDLKSLETLRIQLLDAEFDKHTGKGNQVKINQIKKEIQTRPMGVLLNNGLLQSLSVEIMNKDESVISGLQNDIENLFNKFLKDKDGNNNNFSKAIKGLSQMGWNIEDLLKFAAKGAKEFKVLESFGKGLETTGDRIHTNKQNGDMAKYLSEFIASPDSTAVRLGSALVMTIDIASRKILLDTLLSRGMNEKEAIQIVSEAFVDYKINMPKELKVLSDYGVLLFPSFWMRIQKVIVSTAKANPVGAAIGIGMQNAFDLHIETIIDSNILYKMFGKDLSAAGLDFVHSPPLGLDTFIPTDLFAWILAIVNQGNT